MLRGMDDRAWDVLKQALPIKRKRTRGMSHADFRRVLNAILWVTITGARWCDLLKDVWFYSKSSAHRWLLRWQRDGTWQKILEYLLQTAVDKKLLTVDRLLVDGSFSPCETRGRRSGPRL